MARLQFPNTVAGLAQANAVPNPKHIIEDPRRGYTVLTDSDMPEVPKATDAVLTRTQLLNGALAVGGQTLWNAVKAFIEDQKANGPPEQQNHWATSNVFLRNEIYTRQLRLAIKGAKSDQQSRAEMDNIFLAGSGYEPPMSAG
jgi:hypothetical protein